MANEIASGLALMRKEFSPNQVSKLPKPTRAQTDAVRADFKKGIRCKECGAWHHPDVVHLDYVGHAALTDRLLDCDPQWSWEPMSLADGLPLLDKGGGLWIRLTVCGVTRLGYGDAGEKVGGDAMKERIGDALRNAAMRFGAALDLWHKGDLHAEEGPVKTIPESSKSIAKAELDKLPGDRHQALAEVCKEIVATFHDTGADEAYDMYVLAKDALDLIEEQAAMKALLPAPVRTAFGKVVAARKIAEQQPPVQGA